jgi:hypothetical protein
MYDEISFLFSKPSSSPISNMSNNNGRDIFTNNVIYIKESPGKVESNTNNIKSWLYNQSYKNSGPDENPYSSLLTDSTFSSEGPLQLRPQDFAYLTDLGVYPLNRLLILRRFDENISVPHNLNDLGPGIKPISTMVGFIKMSDEDMFNLTVSEKWTDDNTQFHTLLQNMIKNETAGVIAGKKFSGIDIGNIVPNPSWSQGFIFSFLKKAGLTGEYDSDNLPIGDPNVLRVASRREVERQSLDSDLNIKFETSYEQKYINNIDPGSALLDVFHNCLRMGTSDMNFILNQTDLTRQLQNVAFVEGGEEFWSEKVKELIKAFEEAKSELLENLKKVDISMESLTEGALDLLTGIIKKYRWELKSSLGLMTGLSTAPWHLTVGNPYNPILSIGNMIVNNIKIGWGNEIGFNDMPTKLNVGVDLKFGRPLGKQEIMQIFNNGYGRDYVKPKESTEKTVGEDNTENI